MSSIHATKPIINRRTGKPFTRQTLYKHLTKKVYIGLITLGNKRTPATQFESQVPKADWDKVQASLQRRDFQRETRGKVKPYKSPIARLGKCHFCGLQIVTQPAKKGTYMYLRCSSGKGFTEPDCFGSAVISSIGKPGARRKGCHCRRACATVNQLTPMLLSQDFVPATF